MNEGSYVNFVGHFLVFRKHKNIIIFSIPGKKTKQNKNIIWCLTIAIQVQGGCKKSRTDIHDGWMDGFFELREDFGIWIFVLSASEMRVLSHKFYMIHCPRYLA